VGQAFSSTCQNGFFYPIVAGPWTYDADPPAGSSGGGFGAELTSSGFFQGSLTGVGTCWGSNSSTTFGATVSAQFDEWWCSGQYPVIATPIFQCSASQPIAVTLFDPIADHLASGIGLVSNPAQLAAANHAVQGLSADSATQVLVQISGPGINPGDSITLVLADESGPSSNSGSAGWLTALPANGADSRASNGAISIQAVAIPGSAQVLGFAVLHAPTDFVRALNIDDPTAAFRTITITATDRGSTTTIDVAIVRPPVVFIHGMWGSPSDFMASDGGVLGAFTGSVPWQIHFARYDQSVLLNSSVPSYSDGPLVARGNVLGFLYGATHVLPQIQATIGDYKYSSAAGASIASTQVDIVAHSMGGDITRTLPQLAAYAGQDSYFQGYVHKLITIATPHLGTPLANNLLLPSNGCVQQLMAIKGRLAITTAVINNNVSVSGAVGDLRQASAAVGSLQNLPTALIGGKMKASQEAGAGQSALGEFLVAVCGNSQVNDPMAVALNPVGWIGMMQGDSDGVVPLLSQFNGSLANSITSGPSQNTFPAIHSANTASLGFVRPSLLDEASGSPTEVVNLLNTPVTNSAVFLSNP
jgi:pimeloyl-ACP methyl ester carboxylesterase